MTNLLPSYLRRLPAFVLVGVSWCLAGTYSCFAETRTTNMWWAPQAVTKHGHDIDRLLMIIFWMTLAVFVLTQGVYLYFIIKYRYRKGVKAVYSHGNNQLEIIWTAVPAVVFIFLAVISNRLWLELRSPAPNGSLKIDVVAYQFGFHIRNPGQDGKLGGYSLRDMRKGDNNFGQVLDDPNSFDDYQSENQLTLPVNRPVQMILRSQDVIHAFYVPEFRVYQDMVPGHEIDWMWFVPEKTGHYALACSQLCGTGHYNMRAKVDVVSQEDYDKLVKEKSAAALKIHEEKAKTAQPAPSASATSPAVAAVTNN